MNTHDYCCDSEKLLEIITAFNSEKDYRDLLNVILSKMMEITNADAGTLYILEDNKLHFKILRNISLNTYQSARDKINLPPIELDENNIVNVCAYSAIKNEIVSIDDVYTSAEFNFSGPKKFDKITGYRTCSMLTLPLTATADGIEEVIGVIQLLNATDKSTGATIPFGDIYNPPILPALSNISANALANLMYVKEIKELFNSFVRVMTQAIDERSPYNVNHTNNVALYSERFAQYLSSKFPENHIFYFNENRREQLVTAAFLHDIGKIITPLDIMDKSDRLGDELKIIKYKFEIKRHQIENSFLRGNITKEQYEADINNLRESIALIESSNAAGFLPDDRLEQIRKLASVTYISETGEETTILTPQNMESLTIRKGTLTDEERSIMQEHVSVTGRLLNQMIFSRYYKDVVSWAESHHEFLDGSGYPLGLKGEQLTPEVCILSIMDIYDALTASDRPYKKAMPIKKAFDILRSMASEGKLHGELVNLFIESRVWEV